MLVHRYWQGPPPAARADVGRWLDEVTVIDWTPATVPAAAAELIAATAPLVIDRDQARHAANVVRLDLLHRFGGHWLDHDVSLLGPLLGLPPRATAAHRGGYRCNCWLTFPAHDPALAMALTVIAASPAGMARSSTEVSGEGLLERLWGPDVERVQVRFDVDGSEDRAAPRVLVHAGWSANAANGRG